MTKGPFVFSPPVKRSIHTLTTGMLEPNTTTPPSTTTAATTTANGASFKRSKPPPPPLTVPPGHTLFRLVCHHSRIGGVIGKSGAIIKQLQQETAAKIRIEDPAPGSEERVIVVIGSSAVNRKLALKLSSEKGPESSGVNYELIDVSAAQEALVRVFERVLHVAAETDGITLSDLVSCRLLAEVNQAGSVIGKGGKVVEKIRKDTGCRIRVLSPEKSPACASPNDETVEIEGDVLAVKRALVAVSFRLQDFQPIDKIQVSGSRPVESNSQETLHSLSVDLPSQRTVVLPTVPASSAASAPGGLNFPVVADSNHAMELNRNQKEVIFRILCPSQRVGSVIGRGGTIVKALQNESGASISIGAPVPECEERLITITAMEDTELRYSPAQNAAVLVFCRLIDAGVEKSPQSGSSNRSTVSARLLVPSNQVGCLLGKGGAIVSNIRKTTGTGIRIIGDDQVPKCASESDKVVQITGEIVNVEDAIFNVTAKLRENLFPRKLPDATGLRNISPLGNQSSPYNPESTRTSVGLYSGVPHNFNRPTALTQSHGLFGLSHSYDTPPSSESWSSQTIAGSRPRSTVDLGRGPASGRGGPQIGSENRPLVTNTTVEISVPESDVGAVYGDNGSNLTRLRLISGAKVTVHEPRSGTTDRTVIISGTPDETQAAQSLLHAFILAGS